MRDRGATDLFARLPGHFRTRDAEESRVLEALMAVFASELQILEQDIDQLYDDWFVETCEPWALPFIAELVGARPMREIGVDQAGLLRAYVADVLQFRQAKGTAASIEQVSRSVSGWYVVAVEFFQRLAMTQHLDHVRADAPAFASVRVSARARESRSPFSEMAHAPAAGTPAGWSGRYNVPHLGLFVWRHQTAPVWPVENPAAGYLGGAQPRPDAPDPGLLTFDPLGRDMPLVNRPAADRSIAARMNRRTVPAPLTRDEVSTALDLARRDGATPGRWFEDEPPFRVRLDGAEVPVTKLFCCNLEKAANGTWRRPANAGEMLVDPELGRLSLHASDEGKPVETGFALAAPFDIGGGAYDRRTTMEQWLPEFVVEGEPVPWQIGVSRIDGIATDDVLQGGPVVTSLREAVRRWNEHAIDGARGIIAVLDNATYAEALNGARRIRLPKGAKLAIVAASWALVEEQGGVTRRVAGQLSPLHRRPLLLGPIMIDAADAGDDTGGALVVDGLVVSGNVSAREGGDLGALRLYNCTVGASGHALTGEIRALGDNARMSLVLERCIVARVNLPTAAGAVRIGRSIIGEDRSADGGAGGSGVALRVPQMDATVTGSTVFGRMSSRSIHADNCIVTGRIDVGHHQTGCVRFSYVDESSALPRRYRCVPGEADDPRPRPVFVSTRFQDPAFGQLSLCTPIAILEGAEDGMEMGVGFANREPARRANIRDAVAEFSPFGLVPGLIYMT